MFDILVYLFETYYTPSACPQADVLADKLSAVGFEDDDIDDALGWLHGLAETTGQYTELMQTSQHSQRIYSHAEQMALGADAIGFIVFLEHSGVLPPALREILIDRAVAATDHPVTLENLKVIALMVLWSQELDIDHLMFEELLSDDSQRLSH